VPQILSKSLTAPAGLSLLGWLAHSSNVERGGGSSLALVHSTFAFFLLRMVMAPPLWWL